MSLLPGSSNSEAKTNVARGQVRLREMGCWVVAEATVIAEVVRLPGFVELAPTVAGSAMAPSELIAQLQAEGSQWSKTQRRAVSWFGGRGRREQSSR